MMNEIMVFENQQFGKVRTVNINGDPWFIAVDLCKYLMLGQTTNAVRRLDDDEHALISIKGISRGNDKVTVVNDPGA